jgi:hypothetical protein
MTIKEIKVPNRWLLHSYYTLCPYAPDNSGRLLAAGADLDNRTGRVFILNNDGEVIDSFGEHPVESGFFHTGFWQTWSPDSRYVYYQSGSLKEPLITRRELASGKEIILRGDAEGAPPDGEPVVSGLMGMLYAAGYGYGVYNSDIAPVPFENRNEHGLFEYDFDKRSCELKLSINDIIAAHPLRDELLKLDTELSKKNNTPSGLTLMAYCVRWSPNAKRFLFYFGNHCVVPERGEPRIACLFTCDRDFSNLHLALDMSNSRGVHWSWHPDGEHLIGYGNPPDNPDQSKGCCMSVVRYDGNGFRKLCSHHGEGHPSVSPVNHNLLVTDAGDELIFWDIANDKCIESHFFPAGKQKFSGRNEYRVCHHPAFTADGKKILFNVLDGKYASLYEIETPEV